MHILIVASYYPTERSSAGIFFREQARALKKRGHQVGVLVLPWLKFTYDAIGTHGLSSVRAVTYEPDSAGIPVYRMHWGWFPRVFPPAAALLALKAGDPLFNRYLREHGRPDVLHGHDIFYGGYLAAELGKKYHIPSVITEHSTRYMEGKAVLPGQKKIIDHTLSQASRTICVSRALAESLKPFAPPMFMFDVVPNLIDTDFFSPGASPAALPFTVSMIGRLEHQKRFDILLRAYEKAFRDDTNVQLWIGGDGRLAQDLRDLAAELGITNQVRFLGSLTRDQVRSAMQQSHVVVSSSQFETFGITLIEAMACGKPVIATDSGGTREIITPQTGLLVPNRDVGAFAAALRQMVTTYHTYDPQHIRQYCVEHFSEEAVTGRLEQIYRQLGNT